MPKVYNKRVKKSRKRSTRYKKSKVRSKVRRVRKTSKSIVNCRKKCRKSVNRGKCEMSCIKKVIKRNAESMTKSKSDKGIYTVVLDLYYKQTTNKEILIHNSAIINYIQQFTADEAAYSNFGYGASCITYIRNTAKWLGPMKLSFEVTIAEPRDKYCEEDIQNKGVKGMIIETFLHDPLEDSVYEGMPGESMWIVPWGLKRSESSKETHEELGLIDYRRRDNIHVY